MTREAMCASRIAEAIAQPEITTPQTTVAARKWRSAADVRHSRGSKGALLLLLRTLASEGRSAEVGGQPKSAAGKPNTSNLGISRSVEPSAPSPRS